MTAVEWVQYQYLLARRLLLDGPVESGLEVLEDFQDFHDDALAQGETESEFVSGLGDLGETAPATGRDKKRFLAGISLLFLVILNLARESWLLTSEQFWSYSALVSLVVLPPVLWWLFQIRRRALVAALLPPSRKLWPWAMAGGGLLLLIHHGQLGLWLYCAFYKGIADFHPWLTTNMLLTRGIWVVGLAGLGFSLLALWRCRLWGFAGCIWWMGLLNCMRLVDGALRSMGPVIQRLWLAFVPAGVCLLLTPLLTVLALLATARVRKGAQRQWTHS